MELPPTSKKIYMRLHKYNPNNYRKKNSPEQIHKIFQEIGSICNKFSPSGCSKNFLAMSSDIDTEIEKAHSLASIAGLNTQGKGSLSNSPVKRPKLFPILNSSPPKSLTKLNSKLEAIKIENSSTIIGSNRKNEIPIRLKKINQIILQCKGMREDISIESTEAQEVFGKSKSHYEKLSKRFKNKQDMSMANRVKEHLDKVDYSIEDLIKISKNFRSGKRIWKFNHISFMKGVDKDVSSFKTSKDSIY